MTWDFEGSVMTKDKRDSVLERYETEHRHPVNRALHAVGIPVVALATTALISPWRPSGLSRKTSLAVLAAGWGLLLAGHAIEGNRPAILRTPTAILSALKWWTRGRFVR
jgi:uncharacterized membrane protein YGL010W